MGHLPGNKARYASGTVRAVRMGMKETDVKALRWYEGRSNHGAGAITGETKRLLKAGYLRIEWTGPRTWTITLSDKGHKALARTK